MPDIKNTILRKKIGATIYDLMVKTVTTMVYDNNGTTLDDLLTAINTTISSHSTTLDTMLGGGAAYNISTAISNAISAVTDETDSSTPSLGYRVKTAEAAISAINNATTGILATSKAYTDEKIDVTAMTTAGYNNVSAYIAGVKTELEGKISGALHFKGTVNYVDLLPDPSGQTAPAEGDVYQVLYRGTSTQAGTDPLNAEYAFNGTDWVELGSIIDLSNYFNKTEVTTAIAAAKQEAIQSGQTYTDGLVGKTAMNAAGYNDAATWIATKSNIYVSTQQPANLTESDLWFYEIAAQPEP